MLAGVDREDHPATAPVTLTFLESFRVLVYVTGIASRRVEMKPPSAGAGEKSEESVRAAVDAVLAGEVSY